MKRKIIITLILVALYVAPVVHNRNWFRTAFGVGGKWEILEPDLGSVIWTYTPAVNIVPFIITLPISPLDEPNKKKSNKLALFLIGEKK